MKLALTAALLVMFCAGAALVLMPSTAAGQATGTINTLTTSEMAAGWRLLFDGTTTAGWRGFRKPAMPAGWTVEDGTLTRTAEAGDIVTVDEFDNVELVFEWKIAPAGNSGVFVRATEDSTSVWHSAPEYQILDNAGHADGKKPETTAGSCYALYAPVKDVTRTPGEWNQSRIIVKGTHVEHWLNGTKLLEFEVGSPDWNARVEKSKFAPYPQFGKATKGRIAIQDHQSRVSYRNIKVKPL
ncbi:MAG: DUF1080 domain-containing protein [Acidobacteria bacterium]|nr:DUF1080 domain-containing protein [Acidobacteriota bacterium]